MFTGLIEAICTVKQSRRNGSTLQLTVDLKKLAEGVKTGDSIAVNGVCLTVVSLDGTNTVFELSGETIHKSAIALLSPPAPVNVERALKIGDRLGGHFVQGHIDGTAAIAAIEKKDRFANIKFTADPELLSQMVEKGSVAVDGISLTIAAIDRESFTTALIPQSLEATTMGNAKVGDIVNIEIDIITKSVRRTLEKILPQKSGLTLEKLKELGF